MTWVFRFVPSVDAVRDLVSFGRAFSEYPSIGPVIYSFLG